LLQGMACIANAQINSHAVHIPFRKATAAILTGFHSASFVTTSFQYCSVHPLPIIFARRQPHFGYVR
jgi:hypothetical protein